MRHAIYPGSFDPVTNGHLAIVDRGLRLFDRLIVAVARNSAKRPLFTVEERLEILRGTLKERPRVEIDAFEGLLVDYCKHRGTHTVLRGLRAVSDFEYEFQMANMNRKLDPSFDSVFLMTGEEHFYISSQFVREVAMFGGDVSCLVPSTVQERLRHKYGQGKAK